MRRKGRTEIILSYLLSLLVTIALLVVWIIYVLRSVSKINDLAARLGGSGETFHLVILTVGCILFSILIVGLTLQLAQTYAERRYSRKQEEFVSSITHEMKSPLAAIKLHAQTLEQPGVSPEDRQRSVGFILQQADRMGTLVDNVLESSRLVSRKKLLDLRPLDLKNFFTDYFEEVRARIEGHGVRLLVQMETETVVMATVDAMHRIMDNLIENAVRFSARNAEVRCRITDQKGGVRIEVEDDGIGIPKKELPKIFDRFYLIGREISGRRKGTGLGLSIVSGLVREMRGSVHAFSQEGRPGTRLVVHLPAAESQA